MGLLDDAIREHLDLKRRRGADPTEVAREEHEALGPVRREPASGEAAANAEPAPEQQAPAEPHAEPTANAPHPVDEGPHTGDATHVLAPEDRHEPPHGDPLREQHHPAHQQELGGAAGTHEPEPEADDADRAGGDEDARPPAEGPAGAHPESTGPARSSAGPEDAEASQAPQQDPRQSDIVHQPTTEFHVEDHQDEEDVLEETPEFLQETPEHDRLWFEQRPPRDFDFDG